MVAALVLLPLLPASGRAAELSSADGYGLVRALRSEKAGERRAAARRLAEAKDASLLPAMVDVLFFTPRDRRAEIYSALQAVAGEKRGERYLDWVELVGTRAEVKPKEGYLDFKAELFSLIDERYRQILYAGAPARIRLEEVVSGGVGVEGIPALDNPRHIPAAEAKYLADSERVFGVSVGGEQRAYPLRILDWHEMANDVVGGEPVTLSYCTLCGSGVLFSTRTPSGKPYTFGTSGLLYRSNKLMMDRQTLTLWSNLTGEPQIGRLATSQVQLQVLPLTLTTWKEWRERHPGTRALALDQELARRWGFDYRPGVAERRRAGVRFPVPAKSDALDERDEVYALRLGGVVKAYPVDTVLKERVVNDRVGSEPVALVGDPGSGAVRAYRRGERTFRPGARPDELFDEAGRRWVAGEEELSFEDPAAVAAPPPLPRLPGHQAFWFGWYAFFPQTELYRSGG